MLNIFSQQLKRKPSDFRDQIDLEESMDQEFPPHKTPSEVGIPSPFPRQQHRKPNPEQDSATDMSATVTLYPPEQPEQSTQLFNRVTQIERDLDDIKRQLGMSQNLN